MSSNDARVLNVTIIDDDFDLREVFEDLVQFAYEWKAQMSVRWRGGQVQIEPDSTVSDVQAQWEDSVAGVPKRPMAAMLAALRLDDVNVRPFIKLIKRLDASEVCRDDHHSVVSSECLDALLAEAAKEDENR